MPQFLLYLRLETVADVGCIDRNEMMESAGYKTPRARKTGTTIAGIIFKVVAVPMITLLCISFSF
jgi:hypothetical protein